MRNYNKKSYHFIYFLIINLLTSCSSTSFVLKPYQKSDIEITDNFSLEGKFKLSMPDSKETGYFFLKKTGSLIQMSIGKNYLLPEEELLLDIKDDLNVNKLISKKNQNKTDLQLDILNTGDLIKLILGYEIDLSSYNNLEVFREFNEDQVLPTRVKLKNSEYELIILNKKIYE